LTSGERRFRERKTEASGASGDQPHPCHGLSPLIRSRDFSVESRRPRPSTGSGAYGNAVGRASARRMQAAGPTTRAASSLLSRSASLPGPPRRTHLPRSAKHADASGPALWGRALLRSERYPSPPARPPVGTRQPACQRGVGILGSLGAVPSRKYLSPRHMRADGRFVESGMVVAFRGAVVDGHRLRESRYEVNE
jgi:hypothetical protein